MKIKKLKWKKVCDNTWKASIFIDEYYSISKLRTISNKTIYHFAATYYPTLKKAKEEAQIYFEGRVSQLLE